ncbi:MULTISPECIES: hypothetical protein [Zhenhengia]|uniref:hypothetical protein n=1 Tax=Zhenhengia TaxID=2944196 RepID=UPI002A75275E|nr:hypothetical protein [Zhenhengia yiwuensis]MDY3369081.1 hypothetical protein [Zhenhengia yiwuensis]
MSKLSWGSIAIILGSLVLSLQLYGFRLYAQTIGFDAKGLLKSDDITRASLMTMGGLIIYGGILVVMHFIEERKKY